MAKNPTRGTDEAFIKLMKVSGSSILKLFDFSAIEAEKYHFHAVELKEKNLKPDVEGFPILKSEEGRVFIEFQGYEDPFIRHRLMAEVFLACEIEQYDGFVMAGIVYTDEKYKKAANSLNTFRGLSENENCHLQGCFQEIVLTDYTEQQLEDIDPKLIVLAPFTLPKRTGKTAILAKGREWQNAVTQIFPTDKQREALNVLGLLILNRFRKITYEEVIAMLNFDLMDTVAGKQLYDMGGQNVRKEWLENNRETVLEILKTRFGVVSNEMSGKIRAINKTEQLKKLIIQATLSSDIDSFNGNLSS